MRLRLSWAAAACCTNFLGTPSEKCTQIRPTRFPRDAARWRAQVTEQIYLLPQSGNMTCAVWNK